MGSVKRNEWHFLVMAGVLVVAVVCLGCRDTGLATVEGLVTFDGEPVEEGSIVFEPADGAGAAVGGGIVNGQYRLAGENGVPFGKKIVRISATRKTGQQVEPMPGVPLVDEVEQFIPPRYNQNTELTVDISAGDLIQDFPLSSND